MRNNRSVMVEVEKLPVGHFHHALADNVIVGSGYDTSQLASHPDTQTRTITIVSGNNEANAYSTPNFSSLITFGTRSMTWALPRSTCTPSGGCIAAVKA